MEEEEPRIVFDLGSHAIKAGFAGGDDPIAVVPSVVGTSRFSKGNLPVSILLYVLESCHCILLFG